MQYGALPYRQGESGGVEVLLVTSRKRRRWIIPKGWPIKGLPPPKAAAREAFEEAGVRGTVGSKLLGKFTYDKQIDEEGRVVVCEVTVFPLAVTKQLRTWPEMAEREVRWIDAGSLAMLEDDGLRRLIEEFVERPLKAEKRQGKSKSLSTASQLEGLKIDSEICARPILRRMMPLGRSEHDFRVRYGAAAAHRRAARKSDRLRA